MTTLVKDFMHDVGTTLQDNSPPFRRWPSREIAVYLNYAQRAIAKYLPQAGSRTDAVKLAPGTKQDIGKVLTANIKPGDGSAAADAYGIAFLGLTRNMGADGLTPGRAIRDPVDRYSKDTGNPLWHMADGAIAVREVVFDKAMPLVFYTSPPVHQTTPVWVEMQWMAEPTRVDVNANYDWTTGVGATLGIRDQYVEDAHNYVVAMALLKGSKNVQNLPKSQYHGQLFIASINTQAAVLSGVSPNIKTLPFVNEIKGAA